MIKRVKLYICRYRLLMAAVLVVVAVCLFSRWWYDEPTADNAAVVEECKYYVVKPPQGGDSLYVYAYNTGDTLLAMPSDTAFMKLITRSRHCSWVNRFWMSSCFGMLASKTDSAAEAKSRMRAIDDNVAYSFVKARYVALGQMENMYRRQLSEIDYYIKTHTVDDEGFDIVARRREAVIHNIDSVGKLMTVARLIVKAKAVRAGLRENYTVVSNSLRMPARAVKSRRNGFLFYSLQSGGTPDGVRPVYAHASDIGYGMKPCEALLPQPDTVVLGRRDKSGRYQGVVSIFYPGGSYYEGEVLVSLPSCGGCLPNGFGVEFSEHKVRAGKWENGRYRGEQPVYTSAHIYGIDISRYQHEPSKQPKRRGRRRRKVTYPIEWGKLRITSLGKISEKRVSGTVDFPISFIYIKCSEGKSLLNAYYKADCLAARKHGYRIGAYHFFSTKVPVAQQCSLFLKNCNYHKGDLPPALDVEPSAALIARMGGPDVLLSSVREWLAKVEASLGVRPILYVNQIFVNKYLTDKYVDGKYLRDNYQVWIARYGQYKPDVHLAIWQLSPDGRVRGIHGDVDINVFNGYDDLFGNF